MNNVNYKTNLVEMEKPYFEKLIVIARGNQSRITALSGLNRGTVRKKLQYLGLLKYTQSPRGWKRLLKQGVVSQVVSHA